MLRFPVCTTSREGHHTGGWALLFSPGDHPDEPGIAAAVLHEYLGAGGSIIRRHGLSSARHAEKRGAGHLDISDRHELQS